MSDTNREKQAVEALPTRAPWLASMAGIRRTCDVPKTFMSDMLTVFMVSPRVMTRMAIFPLSNGLFADKKIFSNPKAAVCYQVQVHAALTTNWSQSAETQHSAQSLAAVAAGAAAARVAAEVVAERSLERQSANGNSQKSNILVHPLVNTPDVSTQCADSSAHAPHTCAGAGAAAAGPRTAAGAMGPRDGPLAGCRVTLGTSGAAAAGGFVLATGAEAAAVGVGVGVGDAVAFACWLAAALGPEAGA